MAFYTNKYMEINKFTSPGTHTGTHMAVNPLLGTGARFLVFDGASQIGFCFVPSPPGPALALTVIVISGL